MYRVRRGTLSSWLPYRCACFKPARRTWTCWCWLSPSAGCKIRRCTGLWLFSWRKRSPRLSFSFFSGRGRKARVCRWSLTRSKSELRLGSGKRNCWAGAVCSSSVTILLRSCRAVFVGSPGLSKRTASWPTRRLHSSKGSGKLYNCGLSSAPLCSRKLPFNYISNK